MIKNCKKQSGVAAVELALLLPILLGLAFGITEFGRAMYQYNTLVKNVRDASRYLSQVEPGAANDPQARCLVVYGRTDCLGDLVLPGLTTGMVTIMDSLRNPATHLAQPTGSGVVNLVTVTITGYQFISYVNLGDIGPSVPNMTFASISSTMRQN